MTEHLLRDATARAEAGAPEDAAALCRRVLAVDPACAGAWHILGRCAVQQGDLAAALTAFARAAGHAPDDAEVHYDWGNAAQAMEDHQAAVTHYNRALELRPDHADAAFELGNALLHLKRPMEARASLQAAVAANPSDPAYHHALGIAHLALKDYQAGADCFEASIALDPSDPMALYRAGATLALLGRPLEAINRFTAALDLEPGFVEALNDRAMALRALGRIADASEDLVRAVNLSPAEPGIWRNLGQAFLDLGRLIEALGSFERAASLDPGGSDAHVGRGQVLLAMNRPADALAAFDGALAVAPNDKRALLERGNVLQVLARPEEAVTCYDRILSSDPADADALNNRANALQGLGRMREALAGYEAALLIRPDHTMARLNRGYCRLKLGIWPQAWADFEARWHDPMIKSGTCPAGVPLWTGAEDLSGRTILLVWEQGLGDTVQFVRFAPLLARRGARVIVSAHASLVRLLRRTSGVAAVVAEGETPPPVDFYCPVMSLPLAFGTTVDTVPARPYLRTEPERVAAWRERLDKRGTGVRRVGLVWAGSARRHVAVLRAVDARRSIPLSAFAPLAHVPGVMFVSLQKDEAGRQANAAPNGLSLYDPTHLLADFADTADLMGALDLVISVDTAAAHVAGALGRPVWVLNRFDACWRWLEDRTDTPWYPSARLFRQPAPGQWEPVMQAVAAALRD